MAKKRTGMLSKSDKALLAAYLRLSPEDQEKVMAYVALLRAERRNRPPSAVPPL